MIQQQKIRLRVFFLKPMAAALIFQGVSVFVGVASVLIFLIFLNQDEFLCWILITTFGALTIQIEQGIQIVAARKLARPWHRCDIHRYYQELALARRNYRRFSLAVFCILGSAGFLYFSLLAQLPLDRHWPLTWILFVLAYVLNYWFGHNSAILLSSNRTASFNLVNALTRSFNFFLTVVFLWMGLSILGLVLSFFISVCLSVTLHRRRALQQIKLLKTLSTPEVLPEASISGQTLPYTIYTISNFMLYKGAFLLFPLFANTGNISNYGLALQLVTIVYTISIIPTQIWMNSLVEAVLARDGAKIKRNTAMSLGFGISIFTIFFTLTVFLAEPVLHMLGSDVSLPLGGILGLIFLAFAVESVIFTIANALLIMQDLRFLRHYIFGVITLLSTCVISQLIWNTANVALIFLMIPLAAQSITTLPIGLWSLRCRLRMILMR